MTVKIAVGRPPKFTYRTIIKLADAVQHNATITDACLMAHISRDTYYRYLKNEPVFAEIMATAKNNQNKLVMNFLTTC